MGAVKIMLSEMQLKDRETHNSRLFVDLCENIHIHFREYRFVFSLPEYFEFLDVVNKSTDDVRNYLAQNPDYEENAYKTTLMVAGGNARQVKFLQKSPEPNRSAYFNNSLRIELQEEHVTDEIHVHYRDFRLCLNRDNFKDIAEAFTQAKEKLRKFETTHQYARESHRDRAIDSWTQDVKITESDTPIMGVKDIPLPDIRSHWYGDMLKEWHPDPKVIAALRASIRNGNRIAPVVLVKTPDSPQYTIVDGHHRVRAALEERKPSINCVILADIPFSETKPLREAEEKLKEFDKVTGYKFRVSEFFRTYLGYSLNDYYRDQFHHVVKKPWLGYRLAKDCKSALLRLPLPPRFRASIAGMSGSKKYWR